MPEIVVKKQIVAFIKVLKRENGNFVVRKEKTCIVWKPKELHEFLEKSGCTSKK